jgi:hypothetical protein
MTCSKVVIDPSPSVIITKAVFRFALKLRKELLLPMNKRKHQIGNKMQFGVVITHRETCLLEV